jgi:hydroxyacyl-ACP dehydratase HTD2-like protein with hotdog domain
MNLRGIYGYEEEKELLQSSRELFPFYFHLHTPVRDEYQYLAYLERLYATGPRQLKQLRRLYQGDNLRFYRDFVAANRQWFEGNLEQLEQKLRAEPMELVLNLVNSLEHPKKVQLAELLKLAYRTKQISGSKEDASLRDTYHFNYVDLSLKRPIEEYGPGKTDILLEKKDGKFEFKVLQIHWD